ncbi:MarR family transcriptional regulator [Gorillibacterium sp. CAU 1737]|uniref:MarR family winged helix-turn-helix transcriptional regulator n=1 Tax=Gorillibacterium sp. CAU 1737 TaxID=3140362 RepID=UPI003261D382
MTEQEGPPEGSVQAHDTIFELLQELNQRLSPKFEKHAGLSPTRLRLLQLLFKLGPISQNALQKQVGIDAAAVTRHLKGLEESDLVARRTDPSDGRVTLVSLTEKGRAGMESCRLDKKKFLKELLSGFSDEEAAAFALMLERLCENVKRI